jgi:excisionase family DNA binding protein
VAATAERYLSLQEVGDEIGVSDQTVRRWVKAGELAAYKPGKEYRIKGSDLEEFLKTREVSPKVQSPLPEADEARRPELSWKAAQSHAKMGARLAEVWGPELEEREEAADLQWLMRIAEILADYEVVLRELLENVTLPDKETAEEVAFLAMDLNAFLARIQEALPRVKEEAQRTKTEAEKKASR